MKTENFRHGLDVLPIHVTERCVIPEGIEYPVITKSIAFTVGA